MKKTIIFLVLLASLASLAERVCGQEISLVTGKKAGDSIRMGCKVAGASEATVKIDFGDGNLHSVQVAMGNQYVYVDGIVKGPEIKLYCPRFKAFLCMDQQLSQAVFSPALARTLVEVELSNNDLSSLDLSSFPKLNYLRANGNPRLNRALTSPQAPLRVVCEVDPDKTTVDKPRRRPAGANVRTENSEDPADSGSSAEQTGPAHEFSAESLIPVRPGDPGKVPFWNYRAVQFLYPPAFDVAPVPEAKSYRFTVTNTAGARYTFDSDAPYRPLTPIWGKVQVGLHLLTIDALDSAGRRIRTLFTKKFHRAAEFENRPLRMEVTLEESLHQGLDRLVHSEDLSCWFTPGGKPDTTFILYRYPSKMVGSAAAALAIYASQNPVPQDAAVALAASRRAADYLLDLCFSEQDSWAGHPLTYHPTMFQDLLRKHKMYPERYMTSYGAVVAEYLMEVYSATGDEKYWKAVERIAETYLEKQLPEGTWPLLVNGKTGERLAPNLLVPTIVIGFMQEMGVRSGDRRYDEAAAKALAWIDANPVKTWNWQGQFEDVRPTPPYQNLTQHEACDFAIYLLKYFPKDREKRALALDLIRFSEDQFVVWGTPPSLNPAAQNSDGVNARNSRWLVPCVLEQYRCYAPVSASSAKMISSFIAAYEVTGDRSFLQKANALAEPMVNLQQTPKAGGRYETWIQRNPGLRWLNCEIATIQAIRELIRANESDNKNN